MKTDTPLAEAANIITRSDGYNITTVEPIVSLFRSLIDTLPDGKVKRGVAVLAGLMQATGLGTSHIHVRINAVQLNNAFRAFVHEPWTRDLSESQALARIVEMIETARKRDGELRDARPRDGDRHPPVRADRADPEARRSRDADPLPHRRMRKPGDDADRGLLRQAVRRRPHRRHLAAVRDAARPRDRRARHRAPPGREGLRRLCEAPEAAGAADRLLRRRPLHRPDRRDAGHRASAPRSRRGDPPRRPQGRRDADLLDARRVHGPRRPSRRDAHAPALRVLR